MISAYLVFGLIFGLMLLEAWHDRKTGHSAQRLQRHSETRNAAVEYSNVAR